MRSKNNPLSNLAEQFLKLTLAQEAATPGVSEILTQTIGNAAGRGSLGIPNFWNKIKKLNTKYPDDQTKSLTLTIVVSKDNVSVAAVNMEPVSQSVAKDPEYQTLLNGLTIGIPAYFARRDNFGPNRDLIPYLNGTYLCEYNF